MGFEINERLDIFIKALDITPYEFSKKIGNKRPDGLYKILDKKTKPSPKTLDKISGSYPNLNMNWLLNGEGNLLKEGRNRLVGSAEDDIPSPQKGQRQEASPGHAKEPEMTYGDLVAIRKDIKALAEGMTSNFEVVSRGITRGLRDQQKILDFISDLDPKEISRASKGLNEFLAEKEE